MSRLLYLDCVSGVSGDMLLAALVDAGVSLSTIEAALQSLPLPGWRLREETVQRGGLRARRLCVELEQPPPEPPRHLAEVEAILAQGALPEEVVRQARSVFGRLAAAEARAHGSTLQAVPFHAVGATDAIIDVIGVLVALRALEVQAVYASPVPLAAGGVTESGHGPAPLPAQATLELLRSVAAPVRAADPCDQWELVTPTGAALLAELAVFRRPALQLMQVGVGAGARDLPHRPNVLRAWLGAALAAGEPSPCQPAIALRSIVVLETTIDDMPAEQVAYVRDQILTAGARDVWLSAVQMKKGRTGLQITVIAQPDEEAAIAHLLLRESTTLGVRVRDERRYEADRETLMFESSLGPVQVKVKRLPGDPPRIAPEFEACRQIAERRRLPITTVFERIQREAAEHLAL